MCRDAVYILKVGTAVGIDLWSPADLRKLPNKAFQQSAQILERVEAWATWPSYILYKIIVLMGKPQ
eukprot:7562205-Karenia_brevis.AAC.1